MAMERINWGRLEMIPEIVINRFGGLDESEWKATRVFFLTHCDHVTIKDLLNSDFLTILEKWDGSRKLYMSKMSFYFLLYWAQTRFVEFAKAQEHRLKRLRNTGVIITLRKDVPANMMFLPEEEGNQEIKYYRATPLSAGYDIGSIMLMIESMDSNPPYIRRPDENVRILYTGNCRVHLRDLNSKSLKDKFGNRLHFTHLYLDTTYFTDNVQELPSRRSVADKLLNRLNRDLDKDETLVFGIKSSVKVGNLQLLHAISEFLDEPIHMPAVLHEYFESLQTGLETYAAASDGLTARLHYDCEGPEPSCQEEACSTVGNVFQHPYEELNVVQVLVGCEMPLLPQSPLEAMDGKNWNDNRSIYDHVNERNGLETIRAIYPTHLSKYEAVRLIKFLGVKTSCIFPLYKPRDVTESQLKKSIGVSCRIPNLDTEPEDIRRDYPSHHLDFTEHHDTTGFHTNYIDC